MPLSRVAAGGGRGLLPGRARHHRVMHLRWVAGVAGDLLTDSEHLPGARIQAGGVQAGAGHGEVAEMLGRGDHELMRGTAGARWRRASADRGGVHNGASRPVARQRSARSYPAARAASSRWSAQPSGAAFEQSGHQEVSAVW